ncbi:LacI family DNA-binding transcriptional regulator [Actinocorallia populi]|uniref:LacI family DNA-binding transcriptional regulator n=1 Tax=Actinocorallia populi TaxID=2079200 RepID=UPI000D0974E8|nr:LacI family DNA-binding transcriptional regulator [Actinocorallia populi]
MGGATIKDVAAAAGVGIATVSRVLSGSGPASEATRQRVLAAAKALEYRPSALGRGLKTRSTGAIGLLVPDVTDPFCAELTAGVLACARSQGGHVVLDATGEDPDVEAELLERLAEQRVEGVIAMPAGRDPRPWQALMRLGTAVVFAGRTVPGLPSAPCVLADEAGGVRSVVEYLAGLGHRRIGFLGGRGTDGPAVREEAFRATLAALGLAVEEEFFARARPTADSAYAAAASLFQRRPDLTAVVAGGHRLGEAAVLAARELTLRVPADVSIAIVEDVPWSELCDPPLTAVAHPARDLGYRACELLLRASAGVPARSPGRPVVLATELMVRASCGPVTGSVRTGRSR